MNDAKTYTKAEKNILGMLELMESVRALVVQTASEGMMMQKVVDADNSATLKVVSRTHLLNALCLLLKTTNTPNDASVLESTIRWVLATPPPAPPLSSTPDCNEEHDEELSSSPYLPKASVSRVASTLEDGVRMMKGERLDEVWLIIHLKGEETNLTFDFMFAVV